MAYECRWRKSQLVPNVVQNNSGFWRLITRFRQSQKCHASVHCTSFSFSCHVLCTGQERMNLSPLTGSRAVICFLWPALLLSISRVVSLAPHLPLFLVLGQSSLPFHHVRLQSWTAPKRQKKKKKKRTLFSSGTFFQLGIKAAVFVRMENTMMLQLDHWDTYTSSDIHTVYIPHHMRKSWQSRSIYCEAVWQSEYKSDKNHFCLVVSQPYKKEPYVSVHGPLLQQKSAEVTCP